MFNDKYVFTNEQFYTIALKNHQILVFSYKIDPILKKKKI